MTPPDDVLEQVLILALKHHELALAHHELVTRLLGIVERLTDRLDVVELERLHRLAPDPESATARVPLVRV